MLALVILDLFHQIGFYLKFLGLHLRLENGYLLVLFGHLLFDFGAKATHGYFDFFYLRAPINDLREAITYLPLRAYLIIPDLVVSSDHFLSTLDNLILENVETLLELVQPRGHFRFLLCESWVTTDL